MRVKGHYPHPWANISQIPQDHQLFWFQKLKVSYWWDCDDESMFKLVKSQAGSSCEAVPTPGTSWPDHYGWPRRFGASF
ncbi:UNVERIFIED_CONTAM: hypothetical protein Sangu_2452000 [Sesamum angustifolium]|uniref:Uncharacterized protein n=1 Tax=Sesamum angustifolium TaxID=2727405 RepID=A0AAW2L0Z1_9LAMI